MFRRWRTFITVTYPDNIIDIADAILILKKAIGLFDNVLGFDNLYPYLLSSQRR